MIILLAGDGPPWDLVIILNSGDSISVLYWIGFKHNYWHSWFRCWFYNIYIFYPLMERCIWYNIMW